MSASQSPPDKAANTVSDDAGGWAAQGPLICGVGMMVFAAAIVLHVSVRLGWWDTVDRTSGADPGERDAELRDGRAPVSPTGPVSSAGGSELNQRAFGSLTAELMQPEHSPELHEQIASVLVVHGEFRLAARHFAAARSLYEHGSHANPEKRLEAARKQAGALQRSGATAEALTLLREELARANSSEPPVPILAEIGTLCLSSGQPVEALRSYTEVARRGRTDTERDWGRERMWDVFITTGREQPMLESYRAKLASQPDDDESLRMCRIYYTRMRRNPTEAVPILEGLLRQSPTDKALRSSLLEALLAAKKYEPLEKRVKEWASEQPNQAAGYWAVLVESLARAGQMQRAGELVGQHLESADGVEGPLAAARFWRDHKRDFAVAAKLFALARQRAETARRAEDAEALLLDEADCRLRVGQVAEVKALLTGLLEKTDSLAVRARAQQLLRQATAAATIPGLGTKD